MSLNYSVYFITEDKTGFTKIGYTNNLRKRIESFQIGNPRDLFVSATIDGLTLKSARAVEKHLHNRMEKYRVRGEWFTRDVFDRDWFGTRFLVPKDMSICINEIPMAA